MRKIIDYMILEYNDKYYVLKIIKNFIQVY